MAPFSPIDRGQAEAAYAHGLSKYLTLRLVILPQLMRYAIPGLGNVWQLVLKDSALISVIGLVELMRQAQIGAGSTRQPFVFYVAAAALYFAIAAATGVLFRRAERISMRGVGEVVMDLAFVAEIVPRLLAGLPLTLQLAGTSILLGALIALPLALAQQLNRPLIDWPIRSYVAVFRGTPLLVQIFLIYYGLGQFRPFLQQIGLWGLFREPYWCAILALTLNTAAYGSEIMRGALQTVPRGQVEAAKALGMPRLHGASTGRSAARGASGAPRLTATRSF